MLRFTACTAAALAAAALTTAAHAATVTVDTTGSWFRSDQPTVTGSRDGDNDAGGSDLLLVGGLAGTDDLRGAITGDLSSLPENAVITSVDVQLSINGADSNSAATPGNVSIYLQQLTTPAGPNATWLTYDGTNSWVTAGGDFDPTVLASVTADPSNPGDAGTVYEFESTANLVAAAQAAYDNDTAFSLIIRSPELEDRDARGIFRFNGPGKIYDPENGVDEGTPRFIVTYDIIPEPASMAMFGLGGLGLLARRRR